MKHILLIVTTMALGGCSTLQGAPTPVLNLNDLTKAAQALPPSTVIKKFYQLDKTTDREAYRNEVAALYLAAIDGRYANFVMGLTSQRKFGASTLDVFGFYASVAAGVATGALENGLNATSTFFQGTQSKLESHLFYEQALPVMISMMDAERDRIRARINSRIAADRITDGVTYGMAEMFSDIASYEQSASVERAIARLAEEAAKERAAAADTVVQSERMNAVLIQIQAAIDSGALPVDGNALQNALGIEASPPDIAAPGDTASTEEE